MAAFQFPDPADKQTVVNPITGSTYQWKEPPGKWVVTVSMREVGDIIWEGDTPPDPIGDYKLWYSTDTLELYFYYCDANGTCAWLPTSAPITMLEDLDNTVFELRRDLNQTNIAVAENENRIGRTIEYSDTAPTIYDDVIVETPIYDVDGVTQIDTQVDYFFNELNFKFWYDTTRLELLVLIKDADGDYSYVPVSVPLTDIDLDALNTQVQANSYSNNQQEQALRALEGFVFDRVAKDGDTMTGDLVMEDANIKLESGSIIFQPIDEQANAGVDGPARFVNLVSKRVRDEDGALVGGSKDYGIRVDLTEGRSGYNKFQFFSNVDGGDPERFAAFNGGNQPGFLFYRGNFKMEGNRIQKLGVATDDTDAVPYGQVKDELQGFKDELIEQVAIGIFRWDTVSSNTAPVSGRFFGKRDDGSNGIESLLNYFRVSNEDINGANQDFTTWEVGDIITWTNSTNSAWNLKYRVDSVPTFQNGHYYFEVNFISQTSTFVQGDDFILTRQKFTNIDFGDLETTYLRLDCDNSPLVTSEGLEIKTDSDRGSGFGEASLTLNGKRDNNSNSAASIKFKNWNYDDTDDVNGYITYRTDGTADGGFFRFSKDIDLLNKDVYNVSNLKLTNPGSIYSSSNERIKFKTSSSDTDGSGIVEFTRPTSSPRRGVTIRGKNTSNIDADIFFSYTNSTGGDAINYVGKQTDNSNNLATTKYVKNYVDNNVTAGATNISISRNTTSVTVQSSTGTNGTISAASSSNAGVMTSSDKSKLDGMSYKIGYGSGNYFITTT